MLSFPSVAEAYRPDPPSPAGVNFYYYYSHFIFAIFLVPSSQRDLRFLSVTLTEKKDKTLIQLTHFAPIKAHSCFTLISVIFLVLFSLRDLRFLSVTLTEKKDKTLIQLTHFAPIKLTAASLSFHFCHILGTVLAKRFTLPQCHSYREK